MPAAIARAYYVAMQPPCGPTFVSVPIDDWTHQTRAGARRATSAANSAPIRMRCRRWPPHSTESKRPALVVGPAVDRAQAVDLMVQVAEKAKAAVWVSPFSSRCSFPERHPQFAGFLHASPGQLSDALREYDLVVVIGAPVFTFHVEGHAPIFDGYHPDLPDHRRSDRRRGHSLRHQHHRHHEAGPHHAVGTVA